MENDEQRCPLCKKELTPYRLLTDNILKHEAIAFKNRNSYRCVPCSHLILETNLSFNRRKAGRELLPRPIAPQQNQGPISKKIEYGPYGSVYGGGKTEANPAQKQAEYVVKTESNQVINIDDSKEVEILKTEMNQMSDMSSMSVQPPHTLASLPPPSIPPPMMPSSVSQNPTGPPPILPMNPSLPPPVPPPSVPPPTSGQQQAQQPPSIPPPQPAAPLLPPVGTGAPPPLPPPGGMPLPTNSTIAPPIAPPKRPDESEKCKMPNRSHPQHDYHLYQRYSLFRVCVHFNLKNGFISRRHHFDKWACRVE